MRGTIRLATSELRQEQRTFAKTRTEAQLASHSKEQEIIQQTDAVATEAHKALQAKHGQIAKIEAQAFQYSHSTEEKAEG